MSVRDVEIRQLRYFIAVAEEGNFTRAAERLVMTQPALSRAVRGLEKDVGAELLSRAGRTVTLTPAGQTLLAEAREMVAGMARAVSRTRHAAGDGPGLTATGPGCDAPLLDTLVRSYNDAYPQAPARTAVGTVDDQLSRLRAGSADTALLRGPYDHSTLDSVLLRREDIFVLLSARHPLADREAIGIPELAEQPVVRWEGANPQLMIPEIWPDGLPGRPGPRVSDGLQMLAVIRLDQGIGLSTSLTIGTPGPPGTRAVRLSGAPSVELRLVWLRAGVTPGIRRFARHSAAAMPGL